MYDQHVQFCKDNKCRYYSKSHFYRQYKEHWKKAIKISKKWNLEPKYKWWIRTFLTWILPKK